VTVKGIAKGRCKLEWLDDLMCKPKDDAGRSRPPASTSPHVVEQGECLEIIAHGAGLSWDAVWNHPRNAGLKELRKNPNVLFPGDIVQIPEGEARSFLIETGKTHTFVLSRAEGTRLDVVLMRDGKPRADEECTVMVAGQRDIPASTDGKGRLAIDLPAKAKHAAVCMASDDSIVEIDLGHIDPIDTLAGVQGRLWALGYHCFYVPTSAPKHNTSPRVAVPRSGASGATHRINRNDLRHFLYLDVGAWSSPQTVPGQGSAAVGMISADEVALWGSAGAARQWLPPAVGQDHHALRVPLVR
jgi:N-acetylmuramoyl-L-alanine amidase